MAIPISGQQDQQVKIAALKAIKTNEPDKTNDIDKTKAITPPKQSEPAKATSFEERGKAAVAEASSALSGAAPKPQVGLLSAFANIAESLSPFKKESALGVAVKPVIQENQTKSRVADGGSTKENAPKEQSSSEKTSKSGLVKPKDSDSKGGAEATSQKIRDRLLSNNTAIAKYHADSKPKSTDAQLS